MVKPFCEEDLKRLCILASLDYTDSLKFLSELQEINTKVIELINSAPVSSDYPEWEGVQGPKSMDGNATVKAEDTIKDFPHDSPIVNRLIKAPKTL